MGGCAIQEWSSIQIFKLLPELEVLWAHRNPLKNIYYDGGFE